MRSRWALPFVLMHIAGFSGAAPAQSPDQELCYGHAHGTFTIDSLIAACSAVIQSGKETQENLAEAFYSRGYAYNQYRHLDRSIEDLDQAIRLNPNLAKAFVMRGVDYTFKRQFDRAIWDLDQAIRLDPNYAPAFYARANAYIAMGQTERAMQDFNKYNQLDKGP
jgi:lipoprotein NlpI